ncbi:MAG: AAA family ATPase, partial [Waterburya sp.]
ITLEIKRVNILIGPQASGKSIIAKLLFYFKSFIFEIISAADSSKNKRDLDRDYKQKFEEYFPASSWGNKNFMIRYSIDEDFIEISKKREKNKKASEIALNYSEFYKNEFNNLRSFIQKQAKKVAEYEMSSNMLFRMDSSYDATKLMLSTISSYQNRVAAFTQLYIPAGRSFYANLRSNIFAFLSENNAVDPFLIEFGTYYERVKSPIGRTLLSRKTNEKSELYEEIASLNKTILCGKYLQKNGEDYLEIDKNRVINLANSSSGQQETLPLAIILGTIAFSNPKIGGNSIYIEEPEAHIFPAAQKNIVELISTVYNARKDSLQFLITTHSPYILTAFNNLLQAGILAVDATDEKIQQISRHVPKTRFLMPQEVAVYSLENGYCQSIIDEETELIDTNIIDEVSNELAIQFDELLELEE